VFENKTTGDLYFTRDLHFDGRKSQGLRGLFWKSASPALDDPSNPGVPTVRIVNVTGGGHPDTERAYRLGNVELGDDNGVIRKVNWA
jgi:hypothetical protein